MLLLGKGFCNLSKFASNILFNNLLPDTCAILNKINEINNMQIFHIKDFLNILLTIS